jgi:hypothetical protein
MDEDSNVGHYGSDGRITTRIAVSSTAPGTALVEPPSIYLQSIDQHYWESNHWCSLQSINFSAVSTAPSGAA